MKSSKYFSLVSNRAWPIKVFLGRYRCFSIFIADIRCRYQYFCITQAVSILPHEAGAILPSAKHFQTTVKDITVHFFFRPHKQRKYFHKLQWFYEARYTLLFCLVKQNIRSWSYFCHQPNMFGWTGHMTSLDSMTVSADCDICKWVSLIDK